MKQAKQLLRKEIKDRLMSITEEAKSKQSKQVQQKLFCTKEWKLSRRVATFLSMKDEVSTTEILKRGFEEEKAMFIPRYTKNSMEMLRIRSMDDFESLPETSWKIKQPPLDDESREAPSPENGSLDLIIVPGLSFTLQGHRLGRGKGYYDKYLHGFKSTFGRLPLTIGLSFVEQIVKELPHTDDDVMIDKVICADDDGDDCGCDGRL